MIVGGIVRRLVTPARPGDPRLDDPHSSVQYRVEYLATEFDPAEWTCTRDEAFFFVNYEDACIRAEALGAHAIVEKPANQSAIPEELRPLDETLPPPVAEPRETKPLQRKTRARCPAVPPAPRKSWVTETYG